MEKMYSTDTFIATTDKNYRKLRWEPEGGKADRDGASPSKIYFGSLLSVVHYFLSVL